MLESEVLDRASDPPPANVETDRFDSEPAREGDPDVRAAQLESSESPREPAPAPEASPRTATVLALCVIAIAIAIGWFMTR